MKRMYLLLLAVTNFHYLVSMQNSQYTRDEYISVDVAQIAHYTGAISNLRFYGEYRPQKLIDGKIEFSLNACDPLPINIFGDIRYFFISAIAGNVSHKGLPIQIEDPLISNVVAVRGKDDFNGKRVELYLGFNKDDFEGKGRKKIYSTKLLVLTKKSTKRVEEYNRFVFSPAKDTSSMEISSEIRKLLLKKGLDKQVFDWKNPEFISTFKELLGDGWTSCTLLIRGKIDKSCFVRDDVIIGNGVFYSNKVYWTQDENKLKGITYGPK